MKTLEEKKADFIEEYAPSMVDRVDDVSFVIDLMDLLESYTKQHADKRCESCMHSYHKKGARGYHDVEKFYKD